MKKLKILGLCSALTMFFLFPFNGHTQAGTEKSFFNFFQGQNTQKFEVEKDYTLRGVNIGEQQFANNFLTFLLGIANQGKGNYDFSSIDFKSFFSSNLGIESKEKVEVQSKKLSAKEKTQGIGIDFKNLIEETRKESALDLSNKVIEMFSDKKERVATREGFTGKDASQEGTVNINTINTNMLLAVPEPNGDDTNTQGQ